MSSTYKQLDDEVYDTEEEYGTYDYEYDYDISFPHEDVLLTLNKRFTLLKRLSSHDDTVVYLGIDRKIDEQNSNVVKKNPFVAIKVRNTLTPPEIPREVQIIKSLDHPAINKFYGWIAFEKVSSYALITEYIHGTTPVFNPSVTVSDVERSDSERSDVERSDSERSDVERSSEEDTLYENTKENTLATITETIDKVDIIGLLKYMLAVCSALSCLHSKGVIHRDIKQENIMCRNSKESSVGTELLKNPYQVTRTEGKCDIVLIDFDCAKKYSNGTHYGQIGTECHHAPEMFIDKGTPSFNGYSYKVDIFASGMTFAELLFGLDSCYTELIDMNIYIEHAITQLNNISSNKRTTSINSSNIRNTLITLQLIKSMISVNPNDRPTSSAVVKKVKSVLA